MSLSFYMDENVYWGMTDGLRIRGVDVLTAQADGRTGFPDPAILDRATELERVLFSQDDDPSFPRLCLGTILQRLQPHKFRQKSTKTQAATARD